MISEKADIVLCMKLFSASLKRRSYSILISRSACFGLMVANLSAQTGPGGVGNNASNRLWLKADGPVYRDPGITPAADGDLVQQWNDFSGNNNHAIQNAAGKQTCLQNQYSQQLSCNSILQVIHFWTLQLLEFPAPEDFQS